MSATAKTSTAHGIANGHWEPTERHTFKLFTFDGSALRKLLSLLVRPAGSGSEHFPAAENNVEKHSAAE